MKMRDRDDSFGVGPDAIRLSRNETESLCYKAARGAGLPWGLAEEAAWAAGWLAGHGVDAASALLRRFRDDDVTKALLAVDQAHVRAVGGGRLCPIRIGTALLDRFGADTGPAIDLQLDAAAEPVLLLPFLARISTASRKAIRIDLHGVSLVLAGGEPTDPAAVSRLATFACGSVRIVQAPDIATPARRIAARPATPGPVLRALEALALRTTVPATEASRTGGAGAGISDND